MRHWEDCIMKTYNGHKNRNHWNVALWIGNDESLYRLALQCVRECPTLDSAAVCLMSEWRAGHGDADGTLRTPDGVKVTFTAVRAALRGL